MRIAVLSDIHANLSALQQVFSFIESRGVEKVFCLGDIAGYGPQPNECIEMIARKCSLVVAGNHDHGLIGLTPLDHFNKPSQKVLRWTMKQVSKENSDYIASLPLKATFPDMTLVHASLPDPSMWRYVFTTEDARTTLSACSTRLCFIGHTHIPMVIDEDESSGEIRKGSRCLVNVGSVGQPRDGNPAAAFGLLDLGEWSYETIRLNYEVQKTTDMMRDAGLPSILARRLFNGY